MASHHLVVDGSNIATEGRATPSLAQLDAAVRALLDDRHYDNVTVVVDATFGHRIDASESAAYEEAILAGELLTPPAGAIGRGDAFILQIAERAGADVFSNDSFQEFHGEHTWLFDEGRLVGGKPVPNVGWVFVLRTPVRGATSRRAVRDAKKAPAKSTKAAATTKATKATKASTGPKPKAPATKAPTKATAAKAAASKAAAPKGAVPVMRPEAKAPAASVGGGRRRRRRGGGGGGGGSAGGGGGGASTPRAHEPLNPPMVYASFVVDHPIGSIVDGTVARFSSHGAYVDVGAASCYVPLRALGDPPPRSAREVLTLGEQRSFEVWRFDPDRKGIDVVPSGSGALARSGRGTSRAAKAVGSQPIETSNNPTDAEEAPVSPAAKKAAARKKAPAKRKAAAKKAPAKRKAAAKKAPAKRKAAARKAPAKRKAAAKKAPAKRKAPAKKKAPAKRKAAAKKAPAKRKAPAKKKAAAKRAPAKRKAPARKTAARKAPAKRR